MISKFMQRAVFSDFLQYEEITSKEVKWRFGKGEILVHWVETSWRRRSIDSVNMFWNNSCECKEDIDKSRIPLSNLLVSEDNGGHCKQLLATKLIHTSLLLLITTDFRCRVPYPCCQENYTHWREGHGIRWASKTAALICHVRQASQKVHR